MAANVHGMGEGPNITDWFRSLPIITQCWFGATVATTLGVNLMSINPMLLVWNWTRIYSKIELWRFITPFCYAGPFAFPTVITVYMLHNMSVQYEKSPYNTGAGGGTADYAFALLFGMGTLIISYIVLQNLFPLPPIFCTNLVFYVMYIWSRRNPTAQANIYGIPVPGIWLPFAYLFLSVVMGGSYFDILHGLCVGHVYYFLVDVVPQVQGREILTTPQFLIDRFGIGIYQPEIVTAPQPPPIPGNNNNNNPGAPRGNMGGYNWGAGGNRLGRE